MAKPPAIITSALPGWRLLIVIDEVRADHSVVYRQLDSQRRARGVARSLEGAILVSTFVLEAMAY